MNAVANTNSGLLLLSTIRRAFNHCIAGVGGGDGPVESIHILHAHIHTPVHTIHSFAQHPIPIHVVSKPIETARLMDSN